MVISKTSFLLLQPLGLDSDIAEVGGRRSSCAFCKNKSVTRRPGRRPAAPHRQHPQQSGSGLCVLTAAPGRDETHGQRAGGERSCARRWAMRPRAPLRPGSGAQPRRDGAPCPGRAAGAARAPPRGKRMAPAPQPKSHP